MLHVQACRLTVEELASHTHTLYGHDSGQTYQTHTFQADAPNSRDWTFEFREWAGSIDYTGGNIPHNNLHPVYGCYQFIRTA